MFDLSGKKALVTGASGGIGGAIAKALATSGAHVIISGTRKEALEELAKSPELSGKSTVVTADISSAAGVEALIKDAGAVDILVCNAGITNDGLAMRMKDEDFERVINMNLTSSFRLIRGAMKDMMKNRWGRIICITSVVGHTGNPGQANYCASKAGLTGMVKSLAAELASRGVTANCVAPGFIATNMTDKLNDEQKARITGNIPMNRMGSPEDIAGSVVFLASNESSYVTGQTIHVNGGLFMA